MAKQTEISPRLASRIDFAHPFLVAIVRVGLHVDRRLISTDRAVLVAIAAEIHEGRRAISHQRITAELKICTQTAKPAIRRLAWAGYIEMDERPAGLQPTRYHLRMPHQSRWNFPIPRKPSLKRISLPPF